MEVGRKLGRDGGAITIAIDIVNDIRDNNKAEENDDWDEAENAGVGILGEESVPLL